MGQVKQPICPQCGSRMTPVLGGSSQKIYYECAQCRSNGRPKVIHSNLDAPVPIEPPEEPRARFRRLVNSAEKSDDTPLPESLIEDLPEEARQLLGKDQNHVRPSLGPRLSNDLARALRDQGYVLDEDARGVRISGLPTGRGQGPGKMSPYDVLRMAADLDGGIQKLGQRRRCSNCDAVLPKDHTTCDWCDTPVE